MDWFFWRIITSERISDSRLDIEERWTLMDVFEAHKALDYLETLEAKAAERWRAK